MYGDGNLRATVAGKTIFDSWDEPSNKRRAPVPLSLGAKPVPIVVEYRALGAGNVVSLHWSVEGGAQFVVGTESLATDERGYKRKPKHKPGQGLLFENFEGQSFETLRKQAVVSGISTFLGWSAAMEGAASDQSSVRYTGWLTAPKPGKYRLHASGDDGCRVWLDDGIVIDRWNSLQVGTAEVEFTKEPVALRFEGRQEWYDKAYVLMWQPPGLDKAIPIPPSAFALPTAKTRPRK